MLYWLCFASILFVIVFSYIVLRKRKNSEVYQQGDLNYFELKTLVAGRSLPLMIVDMDMFHKNVDHFGFIAKQRGKKIRLATKSIRVPDLIEHVLQTRSDVYQNIMAFSISECAFLVQRLPFLKNHDLLVAYPTVQRTDLEIAWKLRNQGVSITLMIDSKEHVNILDEFWHSKATPGTPPPKVFVVHR